MIRTVFTVGIQQMTPDELFGVVARYDVNCVVDIRGDGSTSLTGRLKSDVLRMVFRETGIVYMPFGSLLGVAPASVRDKEGNIDYELAIRCEPIAQGLRRLVNGIEKGFNILIIDEPNDVEMAMRYVVVGRYLAECGYLVQHVDRSGICLTQGEIAERQAFRKEQRYEKQRRAAELGRWGEFTAVDYLVNNDYIILDRNWNLHRGCELDIVALKDDVVHFVEVKTRKDGQYLPPQAAINRAKLRNLKRAIAYYRRLKQMHNTPCQIDSIAIVHRTNDDFDLQHFEALDIFGR